MKQIHRVRGSWGHVTILFIMGYSFKEFRAYPNIKIAKFEEAPNTKG